MTKHQIKQREVINKIEKQLNNNSLKSTIVVPVGDFKNDSRICLTSVHFPERDLLLKIEKEIIKPLRKVMSDIYYYPMDSLHMTIKNIRVINDPPHFNEEDIKKAEKVFSEVIPKHKKFKVYFYRLLLFPNNLALIGTTDPEFDDVIFDLNKSLNKANISDDKKYVNKKYFFINMTLARFSSSVSDEFRKKIKEISDSIVFDPYIVDSTTILTCNAVFEKRKIIKTWSFLGANRV